MLTKGFARIRYAISALLLLMVNSVYAEQIAPPEYQVVDRFGVNVVSGHISKTIETLALGGELGIRHSVSTYNNAVLGVNPSGAPVGFTDKFGGNAYYTQVLPSYSTFPEQHQWRNYWGGGVWVMRVHDHQGSADFKIIYDGYAQGFTNGQIKSNYSYQAVRDSRHTLIVPPDKPGHLLWTKPDGTEVWYSRGSGSGLHAGSRGYLEKIVHPNGFEMYFFRNAGQDVIRGVTTNTGFQLLYNFVIVSGSNDAAAIGDPFDGHVPKSNHTNWTSQHPASVVGINNAIERCTGASICVGRQAACPAALQNGQTCKQMNNLWPMATFEWPYDMPKTPYVSRSTITVTDSANRKTQFFTEPRRVYRAASSTSTIPRLTKIVEPGATENSVSFVYTIPSGWDTSQDTEGYLSSARGILGSASYGRTYQVTENPSSWGRNSTFISVEGRTDYFGALTKIKEPDTTIFFTESFANVPASSTPISAPQENYVHSRGNLIRKIFNKDLADETSITAKYADSCTTSNRKYCNKAEWIADAKGNKTYYTYHSESGQVESVTLPANAQGVIAQTRFEYQQFRARYYHSDGIKRFADSSIWLKVAESYCADSNYVIGSCQKSDEVVTRYEYEHDNLLLTGVTITAEGRTLRTCYQYDIYGNRIGEIAPNANLASCSQ